MMLRQTRFQRIWPGLVVLLAATVAASGQTDSNRVFAVRAEQAFLRTQKDYQADTNADVAAWQFARAGGDFADFATNDTQRAAVAEQGIAACHQLLARRPKSVPGHYYLAIDYGKLAQAEAPSLAAYKLVHEIEREFKTAAELDVNYDYAGPARCLGLLYRDAPGWPLSIGSRHKAREWLDRAAELAPDYPENQLNLAETHLQWHQKDEAEKDLAKLAAVWPAAQTNLTGADWEYTWHDWTTRRAAAQAEYDRISKPRSAH